LDFKKHPKDLPHQNNFNKHSVSLKVMGTLVTIGPNHLSPEESVPLAISLNPRNNGPISLQIPA